MDRQENASQANGQSEPQPRGRAAEAYDKMKASATDPRVAQYALTGVKAATFVVGVGIAAGIAQAIAAKTYVALTA